MTDKTPWTRYTANHPVHVVGEFENECGEPFIIYRNGDPYPGKPAGDKVYITGSELDWQPKIGLLWLSSEFCLSAYERDKIAKILWPTPSEASIDDLSMVVCLRKYANELIKDHPGINTSISLYDAQKAWYEASQAS